MNTFVAYSVLLLWLTVSHSLAGPRCGYESCPAGKPDMLNVHIICHTHDDVGWLKTVDQYYYGANNYIQRAGVQYIIDSVVNELQHDPDRRFIYVETAFFWKWWQEQPSKIKAVVNELVQAGQLEFIGGGWSMNDEAAADYNDIVDQMTLGLRKLRSAFGFCGVPRVAWQIDPFGHSREQASLFAQMGFDGLFLGRIDYQDKAERLSTKTMEMIWNASANLGDAAHLFTGVLYNTYSPPPGFCFDMLCNDEPIIDDPHSADNNVKRRVDSFIEAAEAQAKNYATNHIAITMGNDFNYQQAGTWFTNLDRLIKYTNQRQVNGSKVNVFYSTPSCYLKALNNLPRSWPSKSDDFFPYASDPHAYWTGYFTSRPALKGYVRTSNNFLQVCKQLDALSFLSDPTGDRLHYIEDLKTSMGIAQHHDAVSGTAKQAVTDDYTLRLYQGVQSCQFVVNNAYQALMSQGKLEVPPDQMFCYKLNISECSATELSDDGFTVTVYNPVAHTVLVPVRFPMMYSPTSILGPKGNEIGFQVVPLPRAVIDLPDRESPSTWEIVFLAELPGLSYQTFFVYKEKPAAHHANRVERSMGAYVDDGKGDYLTITNQNLQVSVDRSSGMLRQIINVKENITLTIEQKFMWYDAMTGYNMIPEERASGAYIFRPNGTYALPVSVTAQAKRVKGTIVQEIHQRFNDWISQVIRLYNNSEHVEFDWIIGPIPVGDYLGKEIITRFEAQMLSDDKFYTDSNGREMLLRKKNYRPTWNLNVSEPVSGNYYPVNSRMYIKDPEQDIQLTLLSDRSVGGTSIEDGSMELMLHRRLLYDDAFGVGEPLNEPGTDGKGLIVRGKTLLLVNRPVNAARKHRQAALRQMLQPQLSFSKIPMTTDEWRSQFATQYSGLRGPLPENVHILTLERVGGQMAILRLEHYFEKDEDEELSKPVTVDVENLFTGITILTMNETTLAANQLLAEHKPVQWRVDTNSVHPHNPVPLKIETHPIHEGKFQVTLNPMQIRTFIITFKGGAVD